LKSDSLKGTYTSFPNLHDDILTFNGGIPCGYYDNENSNYWTYIHSNNSGNVVIKRAIHSSISEQIQNFTTVIDGSLVGNNATTTESPGICLNKFILTDIKNKIGTKLCDFSVSQNYPNPFNPSTTISYKLPSESHVKIEIFNTLGERVELVANGIESTGLHSTLWNASHLTSGIYIVRINAISINEKTYFTKSIKMNLIK
jgi:flagellar hook assembly protein FlgD